MQHKNIFFRMFYLEFAMEAIKNTRNLNNTNK